MKALLYEPYDFSIHGNQRYILLMMDALRSMGKGGEGDFDLTLAVPTKRALYDEAVKLGKVEVVGGGGIMELAGSLRRLINETGPDVLLCHNERSLFVVALASFFKRIPIVWHVKNLRRSLMVDLACALLANRVITIAPQCIEHKGAAARGVLKRKTSVLPLGIKLDEFSHIPPLGPHDGPCRILLVAFVSPEKGVDIAIEAMDILDRKGLDCMLRVVGTTVPGDEAYAEDLERKASRLSNARVEWLGWQKDMAEQMAWSDMSILPTRKDSLGRCLVEAMVSSRPVVAADVGGVSTVVKDEVNGYLIAQNDAGALAEKIELLATDFARARSMGFAGKDMAVKGHDIREHMRGLDDILREVVR